jgi:hypothetical protein
MPAGLEVRLCDYYKNRRSTIKTYRDLRELMVIPMFTRLFIEIIVVDFRNKNYRLCN